jgi:hypothetical protein
MKARKIIIAMPTEKEFMPSISRWGHDFNWAKCEPYFVHAVTKDFAISETNAVKVPDIKTFEQIKLSSLEGQDIEASMVVIATRNKRGIAGIYSSSIAYRILELSPCDVLVLRSNMEKSR